MTSTTVVAPELVAREMLARLQDAWNRGDGAAFGAPFTDDASFVNIRGELHVGAAAIGAGHAGIFATIYAGSTNEMELVEARWAGEAVVATSRHTLDCPTGPLAGIHQATSTSVLAPVDGEWRIVASHNTLVVER
jgi:uncharacterized protein (TIGR02246 family)